MEQEEKQKVLKEKIKELKKQYRKTIDEYRLVTEAFSKAKQNRQKARVELVKISEFKNKTELSEADMKVINSVVIDSE